MPTIRLSIMQSFMAGGFLQQLPDALSPLAFLFRPIGEAFMDLGVHGPGTWIVEIVRGDPIEHFQRLEHPAHIVPALAAAKTDAGG